MSTPFDANGELIANSFAALLEVMNDTEIARDAWSRTVDRGRTSSSLRAARETQMQDDGAGIPSDKA
jgi:hypothetical protein